MDKISTRIRWEYRRIARKILFDTTGGKQCKDNSTKSWLVAVKDDGKPRVPSQRERVNKIHNSKL